MDMHVDIVKNQPHAGYSELIARLYLAGEGEAEEIAISLRTKDSMERWAAFLELPIETSVGPCYAQKNPREYLEHLHEKLNSSYQFATELHAAEECEFSKAPWLPMQPIVHRR